MTVVNLKILPKKFLGPPDPTKAQIFCIHKPIKIVVVDQDKNFVLAAFEIVFSDLKNLNNLLKLIIMSLITNHNKNHFSKKISY